MNAEVLLKDFGRISEAPDAIPRLRRFILDLAARGKLVEQHPTDDPASGLVERIKAEKARLVKAGELRQDKPLPSIEDTMVPFHVPATWEWVPIRQVTSDRGQKIPDREFTYIDVTAINKEAGCVSDPKVLSAAEAPSRARKLVQTGDVLYSCVRPYLLNIAVIERDIDPPPIASTAFAVLNGHNLVMSRYLWIVLRSGFMVEAVESRMRGQAYPAINDSDFATLPFPLPPLAEQERIIRKVEELMKLCDRLEEAQKEREARRDVLAAAVLHHLQNGADAEEQRPHARFFINQLARLTVRPDQITGVRQSILSLAVRGRLVSQCAEDEPASKLLDRIKSNKDSGSASGSIRRRVPELPPVDVSRAPFDIPSTWTWARFPELGVFGRGKSKHRPRNDRALFDGGTHPLIQTGDVARSRGVIGTYTGKYNDVGLAQSQMWPAGTLCITIAANIADSGILSFDACFPDSVVGFLPAPAFPNARYFEYFLRTAKENLLAFAPATAQKNINLDILNAVLVPLPPLAEQIRIVERVDHLMRTCDQLEVHLAAIRTEGHNLLEAVLHDALAPVPSEAQ